MRNSSAVRRLALGATALAGLGGLASPAAAVVINDGFTPAQAVDPTNITGVGQMVVDEQNGFLGLCTATLINPRTVILAAHCVNENPNEDAFQPGSAYGSKNGGLPIGVGFQANNNIAGNSAIGHWLRNAYQTNKADSFYNGSYVTYNPASTQLGVGANFFEGDVALIAFDTPVTGVPTTDLLFSPLSGPVHATITGYGGNGIGSTGSDGGNIDYKRRIAENIVSVLGSLKDLDSTLFGIPDDGLPQNLYQTDFNDPKYNTAAANPFDFAIFGDKALPKEGTTAPGDSGGPLLIDKTFSKPVVAAVLSGGITYFEDQPGASYGTSSFYQPLYLFWDWIVANNPYKYVGAKAGDGQWTDPTHWVINLDPIYQTIGTDGQLTNALPTTAAAGTTGSTPKFGVICDGANCFNLATGAVVPQGPDGTPSTSGSSSTSGAHAVSSDPARVSITDITGTTSQVSTGMTITPDAAIAPVGNPPAEGAAMIDGVLLQGAPGSSNFVPNDTDGNPTTGAPARYYDVTLSADGTTTLSAAQKIIDRLSITGANAGLTIASGAGLASLIDTTVNAGTLTVNGTYISMGEFALNAGLLQGTGTVVAPDVISALGAIAPGTLGTAGTLSIDGNLILSSGTRSYFDIGAGGVSDHIVVAANGFVDPATDTMTGEANLGGILALSPLAGYKPTFGDKFTLVTADKITGGFQAITGFSGVLFPQLTQTATTVTIQIAARPYASVINPNSSIQRAYAALLDGSRASSFTALSGFYNQTDLLNQAPLQATLEAAGPYAQQTEVSLVRMQDEATAQFYRDRLTMLRNGDAPTTLAVIGNPLGVVRTGYQTTQDVASSLMQGNPMPQATAVALPEGVSAYVAGGYLDGKAKPLPNLAFGNKDDLTGWYVAAGLEKAIDDKTIAGFSATYSHGKGSVVNGARARSSLFELAAYGTTTFGNGGFLSSTVQGGILETHSRRQFALGTVT
ncbi:MAG: hypothetical protein JWO65_2619, partial [Sphingomonas bacterium]|nr:hypothetical protein [Sphingomonas bacterium]